jgi:hypothetical protein
MGMYREWKKIELCWFGDVKRMEGNKIVLVWRCTVNGKLYNCVGLSCKGNGRKNKCVGLGMYREWKEIELCCCEDVQILEFIKILLFCGWTGSGRK